MDLPYLTDAEIAGICDPLKMPAAQRRYLRRLGLHVEQKPNGRALVARSEFERVLGAARLVDVRKQPAGGDVAAIRERWGNRHRARKDGTGLGAQDDLDGLV